MSDKSFEVVDEETGATLKYSCYEKYGWCCSFPSIEKYGIEVARKAMKNSRKYWPEQSEEHKRIEQEMLDVIRGLDLSEK